MCDSPKLHPRRHPALNRGNRHRGLEPGTTWRRAAQASGLGPGIGAPQAQPRGEEGTQNHVVAQRDAAAELQHRTGDGRGLGCAIDRER